MLYCVVYLELVLISIVIPVFNEMDRIRQFVEGLFGLDGIVGCEVIVVDGGRGGSTVSVIDDERVVCMVSEPGRGLQLNAGAASAKGDVLLFLHADTVLPVNAFAAIEKCLSDESNVAGAFGLTIDSERSIYKWIAFWASVRYKYFGLPYGDQGVFMRKDYFESIGRFKDFQIMEDVDLARRIKKRGDKICILDEQVLTSARRWEKDGAVFGTIRNAILLLLFYVGVKPERLVRFYKRKA
jgi:rSAM/selenodomain-associated transferase 2